MRKQDIKPGVLYAWKHGRSAYDEPRPIVFLSAPKDGVLYDEPRRYGSSSGKPVFVRNQSGAAKPGHSSIYGPTGYPAVCFGHSPPEDVEPEELLSVTLADFEAATSAWRNDGTQFTVITSLAVITGPYAEQVAEFEAARKARNEQLDREAIARERAHARADAIVAALGRAGIRAVKGTDYGTTRAVVLSLDEAEKLTALLDTKREAGE